MLGGSRFAAFATGLCKEFANDLVLVVSHNLAARLILAC
jgi:hypothetical protein